MNRIALWVALLCLGATSEAAAPTPADVRLEKRPCWFEYEPKQAGLRVECAALHVPERWSDAASGREVSLPVVVLRARQGKRWATLVPGGGGPGGPLGLESDDAPTTIANHESFATESRGDVVLVDQRGAGLAQPTFRCGELRAATLRWLAADLSVAEEAALWSDAARTCRSRLAKQEIALDAYDSASVAQDLEALRRALGYTHWNVFGTSYAGELALEYARAFPSSVRALVLDSPSIPGADLFAPGWFRNVLGALFGRCAADSRCARDFPKLDQVLDRLLERFAREPLALSVSDPETLEPIAVKMTPARLLDLIFIEMYDAKRAHELPIMLTAADRRSYDWLQEFAREYVWSLLDPRFSSAMLGAVPCRESVPYSDLARAEREAAQHPWLRAFVGVERITTEVCRAWDVGTAPKRATAFRGPALWLAGQLDPIIPLSEIERAAKSVPHSTLIAMPATGHATDASWWSCLDPLIARFLADPGEKLAAAEIAACRAEAEDTPFVTLSPPESLPTAPGLSRARHAKYIE